MIPWSGGFVSAFLSVFECVVLTLKSFILSSTRLPFVSWQLFFLRSDFTLRLLIITTTEGDHDHPVRASVLVLQSRLIPSGPHHNALFLLLHSMMKSDPFYPSSNIQTRGSIKLVSDYPSFWPLIQSRLSLCFDSRIVTHLFHTDIRSVCRRLVIVVGVGITAKFWSNRQQVSLLCLVNCLIVSYCCVTTTSSSNFSLWVNGLTNVIKWNMVQNWKVRRTRNQKESLNTQRGPSFITDVAQHEFEIKQTPESIYTKNPCKVERRRLEG